MVNYGIFFGNISAINAAQVKVTFNKVLTDDQKDEATDLDNYTLENSKDDEIEDAFTDVDVEDGSKEAILTVNINQVGDEDEDFQNQSKYNLTLDENITGEEVKKEFKVDDFDPPEIQSIEVAGIRTIKVKLSEPVVAKDRTTSDKYNNIKDSFEINDGDYSIEKVEPINNGKELNVVLYSDLKDGEELNVNVKSGIEDYAGYGLVKKDAKIKVDVNKEDLDIVQYKEAKDDEITLVFNKDIKFADYEDDTKLVSQEIKGIDKMMDNEDDKYYGYKKVNPDSDTFKGLYHTSESNKIIAAEIDGNELTLHFDSDDQLPETAYIYVDSEVLEDLWDKKNDDLVKKVSVSKDDVKPEIKEVKQDDDSNRKIIITFNEDVEYKSATDEDNYTVKDKDGDKVRVSEAELTDDDEVTLTLSKDLEDGDKYKVSIEDVEDTAGNKIKDTTKEFTAKETEAVDDATARYYDEGDSDQKIVVDFDTEMLADGSRYAIDNLDNYDLEIYDSSDNTKLLKSINLSDYDDASIKSVDNKTKAEIKVPGNKPDQDDRWNFENGYTLKLKINKVDDANENRSDICTIPVATAGEIGLEDAKESPATTDLETVKVVFDDNLDFEDEDVMIGYNLTNSDLNEASPAIYKTENGKTGEIDDTKFKELTPSSKKVDKEDGKTIVTYELKESDQLSFNGKYDNHDVYVVTTKTTKSENQFGDKLIKDHAWKVMDEIKPELALLDEDDTKINTNKIALDDRDDYNDAVELVEFTKPVFSTDGKTVTTAATAKVTLHFEEKLTDANINKVTFDTDDSDVEVTGVDTFEAGNKDITLTLTVDRDLDATKNYDDEKDFLGLGITTGTNEIYDMAENSKDGVNGTTIDTEIESVQKAIDKNEAAKAEATSVKAINDADATGMPKAIKDNAKVLGLDLTDFNALTDKNSVITAMVALDGEDKATVVKTFNDTVAAQKKAEAKSNVTTLTVKDSNVVTKVDGTVITVANGTYTQGLVDALTAPEKGSFELKNADDSNATLDEDTTAVANTMKILVTAEDGTKATYTITLQ